MDSFFQNLCKFGLSPGEKTFKNAAWVKDLSLEIPPNSTFEKHVSSLCSRGPRLVGLYKGFDYTVLLGL